MELITVKPDQIKELSNRISSLITRIIKQKDCVVIAVSGGKSPIPLFNCLSNEELSWEKVTIVLVDERMVEVNDADSNEKLIKTHLLKNKASSARFIGLMNQSTHDIISIANSAISCIDIAILGMGNDGHTASIFPDCPEFNYAIDNNNNNSYILTNPISAKYQRITLTLNALKKIPHLILSISGNEKYNVLIEAEKQNNKNYPISYLIKQRPDIQVYWQEEGK